MADQHTLAGFVNADAETSGGGASRVAGRYEVLGMLGAGAMGAVYRVRDLELDEIVALKVLKREVSGAPGMLARFRQEVKLARRVTHPNVVRTFDLGEDGDDRFITMEYVEGRALSAVLAAEGALPVARAVAIVRALCAGVGAAHKAGVLHRDLKPDNVLLGADERVVVGDFGIARAAGAGQTLGGLVGTPAYMAPEQVRGGALDARTDVYAIGAVLYELVTGRRAWPGDDPLPVAIARLERDPPDPRAVAPVPEALAAAILGAMRRDPAERFPTAEALADALGAVPTEEAAPTAARPLDVPTGGARAVAVLPFKNAARPEDAWYADGLTDELVDALSMTEGLRVRPRGAVDRIAAETPDPREVGRRADVQVVVEGTVRREGEGFRVTARVVGVTDGFQLGVRRFEGREQDVQLLSDAMARAIAEILAVDLHDRARAPISDARALELYVRGRHELARSWSGDLGGARELLAEAAKLAPRDPSVLAAYAMAEARRAFFAGDPWFNKLGAAPDAARAARAAAETAVALGPALGEPWLALGQVRLYERDVPGAASALRAAVARAPGLARAQHLLGAILLEAGRVDEAGLRLRAARAADPEDSRAFADVIRWHAYRGDWERVDALTEAPPEPPPAPEGLDRWLAASVARARYALWRGVRPPVPPDLGRMDARTEFLRILWRSLDEHGLTEVDARVMERSAEVAGPMLRAARCQFAAEPLARSHPDRAVALVRVAVDAGLEDHLWMARCPTVAPLREHPEWPALAARVAERAERVLAAVDAPG